MPKTYSIDKLVDVALSLKTLKKLSHFSTGVKGSDVRVLTNPYESCYSNLDYWTGLNISLGKKFYQVTFNDTKDVSVLDLKEKYKRVASILYGAYYHELFHILYTPFRYAYECTKQCNPSFRNFAHQVANILEDVTIEGTGTARYTYSEKYIEMLKECFSQPEQFKMIKEGIENDPTSASTMLAYLLHFCRGTDMSQFPKYELWENNKSFIEKGSYKCINTIDPYLRTRRQIAFALELCKILEMKEPSSDSLDKPDMNNISSESNSFTPSLGGAASNAIQPMNSLTNTSSSGPSNTKPEETDEDIKVSKDEELKTQKASRSEGSIDDLPESPINADLTKAGITMLANDDPVSRYSHIAEHINKYMKTNNYLPEYNKFVREHDKQIRQVVALIRKMYATNNTSWNRYKMNGKIDSSTFYKKDNYKIFKKKNAPAPTADLVFEILVDNSGSMCGTKAKLAGIALIIFCEALDRLHIPFSVDAFTEANAAVTISLKDYNELYSKTKTNMTLFTEQYNVRTLATWCGNIDEINLQYVSQELLERKEKDKVLIVISDGATCGSFKDLKKVAANVEKQGITVLGIGIFDNNVENIYNKHIVLREQKDLEGLGNFLNNYLVRKIFK